MTEKKIPKGAARAGKSHAGGSAASPKKGQAPRRQKGQRRPPATNKVTATAAAPPAKRRGRKRRGRRTLHYLLLIALVAAAGVILSLTLFFKIESVQVVGTDRYQPADIIAVSGIQEGDNLLRLDVEAIRNRIIEEFPYVEAVEVNRRFPPRVELAITQSIPAYAVYLEGEVALLTREGKLLEVGDLLVEPELPIVKGLQVEGFSPGELLGGEDNRENEERLNMLRYLFDAAEKTGFGQITNVDVTDQLNMTTVYQARLLLILGSESDIEYKLTFLKEVIADLDPDDQARIDASDAKDKQVLVKWGKVENGVFIPQEGAGPDTVLEDAVPSEEEAV